MLVINCEIPVDLVDYVKSTDVLKIQLNNYFKSCWDRDIQFYRQAYYQTANINCKLYFKTNKQLNECEMNNFLKKHKFKGLLSRVKISIDKESYVIYSSKKREIIMEE